MHPRLRSHEAPVCSGIPLVSSPVCVDHPTRVLFLRSLGQPGSQIKFSLLPVPMASDFTFGLLCEAVVGVATATHNLARYKDLHKDSVASLHQANLKIAALSQIGTDSSGTMKRPPMPLYTSPPKRPAARKKVTKAPGIDWSMAPDSQ